MVKRRQPESQTAYRYGDRVSSSTPDSVRENRLVSLSYSIDRFLLSQRLENCTVRVGSMNLPLMIQEAAALSRSPGR